ncbi:16S rRNA (cytosine(1402)-N(4))-methyltransferase RsmH [Gammaproteobacteria bacterium]|nr:16S rRNA (cytosine(1402)-N(4))-methyltransferase RsmH [Gammaproteobacteria bacterium]MDB3994515.1 16S rRNA (cytosine(1402)-N(4))-methyltransferase RsmH [Gammaproteobacteria bacterium]MDC0578007.1 16S rRNA (cytosine(1402)-N(4))-methyltransferase RsmH [Gammaproteobacteria bacterium]
MINSTHEAVMVDEVLENLVSKQNGRYIDCTFGAGGHSLKILKKLNQDGALTSIEKDKMATLDLSSEFTDDIRFKLINDSFSNLNKLFKDSEIDGILIDLGISSTQLDDPERGFSFQSNGPLDMRIDTSQGQTAAEWINSATKKEIEDVLWTLGEERASRKIASKICESREKKPIESTKELSDLIISCVYKRSKKHPATNSFRAIRMFINQEIYELQCALEAASYVLCCGGRLAVISFHSMEDRIVKRFFQGKDRIGSNIKFKYFGEKFLKPTNTEMSTNPRSRSAILRVAEKI